MERTKVHARLSHDFFLLNTSLSQDAMRRFVIMTTSQLPLAIGQPTAELSLAIDSIDIDADIDTFCSKRSTGSVPAFVVTDLLNSVACQSFERK